ncbi:multidrug resistance efflux transporter family protein [Priestia megaterium]
MAKENLGLLGAVEATQSGSMIFTVLGEVFLLNGRMPTGIALAGMTIIVIGMIMNSMLNKKQNCLPPPRHVLYQNKKRR